MEDENRWKSLDLHLLARLARAGLASLRQPGQREVRECVLDCVYRIGLRESLGG